MLAVLMGTFMLGLYTEGTLHKINKPIPINVWVIVSTITFFCVIVLLSLKKR